MLYFDGATRDMDPSPKSRKVSSVKLQIIPGSLYLWQPEIKGTLYVGIWLKSPYMAACLILSVEEGTEACRSTRYYLITFSR